MDVITRKQLQNARAAAIAEKERIAHREQEIKGQLAAEEFYKEVRRVAEVGGRTPAGDSITSDRPSLRYSEQQRGHSHFRTCSVHEMSVGCRCSCVAW